MRLEFVSEHKKRWPVEVLCRVLKVTRAAFYKWLGRKPSATEEKQDLIVSEIKRIHALPRHQDYGSPRMHRELVSQGVECSENTVAKLMRDNPIRARTKPKFRISTTDSKHNLPIAPNRLNQQFTVSKINQVWLTDFTYLPTWEGFSYLCAFKDLCSRRIVGWAMSRKIDAQLALAALHQEVYHEKYQSHEQATRATNDYIERFYNPTRLHSALDYVSPTEFEQRLLLK